MIKTITAAPVERDNCGFWTHPDYFEPANGNEFGVEGEFDAWKALNRVVGRLKWMECEDNAEELQAAYDAGNCDLSMWQPNPPAGDGWFLASIHDSEDGPVCYWLRPIELDPEALAAHFNNCYAEAFKTEHLVAERDAALNACSLIAEALDITGAVAGDTIARVQQLIGENTALWNENSVRQQHADWSNATFGNVGPIGPLKHLSKEALETAESPDDLSEWADMQFLFWDAQRRAGITDEQITQAMVAKLGINKSRVWPEPKDGEPREHIKADYTVEGEPAPVKYIVILQRAWCNDSGSGINYHSDLVEFDKRDKAIKYGFELQDSDDFNIGVLTNGVLTSFDWMAKPLAETKDSLARIASGIGIEGNADGKA